MSRSHLQLPERGLAAPIKMRIILVLGTSNQLGVSRRGVDYDEEKNAHLAE